MIKKGCFPLLLLLISVDCLSAQTREILLLNTDNGQPVSDVNIFNPETLEGFISNQEGKARIRLGTSPLFTSHIGYEIKELLPENDFGGDTLYLTPKAFKLEQVVLHSVDLKEKLQHVLDNYTDLYDVSAKTFDCTYKERLVVNEALTRLAQVQLKWWNRDYEANFGKSLYKQNQLSLTATDYSKIVEDEKVLSTSGFISNVYLLQYIHLNYYPIYLISMGTDFYIKSVEMSGGDTKITFDGRIEKDGKLVSLLEDSQIYFDNETGAITKVDLRMQYQNNVKEDVSREKGIPYTATMKGHQLDLSLGKLPNGKLIPASFHSTLTSEVVYEDNKEEIEIRQSMFFTKAGEDRKIRRKDRIDLAEPFYKNFPTHKQRPAKMLLTEEEKAFMLDVFVQP